MSDGTLNTVDMNASTLVLNGSGNNSRDTDTYTHNISWEESMETDSTLTPGIPVDTSHGNADGFG